MTPFMSIKRTVTSLCTTMLLVTGLAQASPVTIGFDGLSSGVFPSPHIENGFSSSLFAGALFVSILISIPEIRLRISVPMLVLVVPSKSSVRFLENALPFVGLDLAEFDGSDRGINSTTVEGWLNGGFVGMETFTPNQDNSYSSAMAMGALSGAILDEVRINVGFTFQGEARSHGRVDNIVLDKMIAPQPIPEPGTILLMGTGLAGLVAWRWKKPV